MQQHVAALRFFYLQDSEATVSARRYSETQTLSQTSEVLSPEEVAQTDRLGQ